MGLEVKKNPVLDLHSIVSKYLRQYLPTSTRCPVFVLLFQLFLQQWLFCLWRTVLSLIDIAIICIIFIYLYLYTFIKLFIIFLPF